MSRPNGNRFLDLLRQRWRKRTATAEGTGREMAIVVEAVNIPSLPPQSSSTDVLATRVAEAAMCLKETRRASYLLNVVADGIATKK